MTKDEAWAELVSLTDDPAWLSAWMNTPQHWLGGETPRAAMDTEDGRAKLVLRIGQMVYGVYV